MAMAISDILYDAMYGDVESRQRQNSSAVPHLLHRARTINYCRCITKVDDNCPILENICKHTGVLVIILFS